MTDELKTIIGRNLKYIRFQKFWSQAFVCRQIGISIRTLSRAETGRGISKHTLNKLCGLYQVPISMFYKEPKKEDGNKNKPVDLIPDDTITKIVLESDMFSNIQREAILRFNDIIQKDAFMLREDVEKVIPGVICEKKSYSLQDIISVAMAVNQLTIRNIGHIAVA